MIKLIDTKHNIKQPDEESHIFDSINFKIDIKKTKNNKHYHQSRSVKFNPEVRARSTSKSKKFIILIAFQLIKKQLEKK